MKENKEYSRNIRMTNTVKNLVEAQQGKGFNEKFENMVIYCMTAMPNLEKTIKEKEKYIKTLDNKAKKLQCIVTDLDTIKCGVQRILSHTEYITNNIE